MKSPADFLLTDHGSIAVLVPQTDAAVEWAGEHLTHPETQQWAGGTVIEPRYVGNIVDGIQADGLTVGLS